MEEGARSDAPVAAIEATILVKLREAMGSEAAARGLVLGAEDWGMLETDITLNAQGLAFAADKTRTDRAKKAAGPGA
jgi:hypothetical protein